MSSIAARMPHAHTLHSSQRDRAGPSRAMIPSKSPSREGPPDEEELSRGRRRSRDEDGDEDERMVDGTSLDEPDGAGRSRKRRRSRKGLDKKFECRHEGCGKSYSRAEHLSRHELNHNPKERYYCNYPGCDRHFVRQDLCTRHKERHTARGSQLQRKDAFLQNASTSPTVKMDESERDLEQLRLSQVPQRHGEDPASYADLSARSGTTMYASPTETKHRTLSPTSVTSSTTMIGSAGSVPPESKARPPFLTQGKALSRSTSDGPFSAHTSAQSFSPSGMPRNMHVDSYEGGQRNVGYGSIDAVHQSSPPANPGVYARPMIQATTMGNPTSQAASHQSPYANVVPSSQGFPTMVQMNTNPSMGYAGAQSVGGFETPQSFAPLSLPPPGFSTISPSVPSRSSTGPMITSPPSRSNSVDQLAGMGPNSTVADSFMGQMAGLSMPVFGGETLGRSPFSITEDFATWLFGETTVSAPHMGSSPMTGQSLVPGQLSTFWEGHNSHYGPYQNDATIGYYPQMMPQQHPMAMNSMVDNLPEPDLSERKRDKILELINLRFNQPDHSMAANQKEDLLNGDRDNDDHVLSLHMMKLYIKSFWYHFHPQLPILHKPTFVADETPDLLLISMMAIGASCLDKMHGYTVTQNCSELSNFLAWQLRWEIFSDSNFMPPAKLWIFQALLLLEIYEKMYSTRALHERSHIHHATTITLMRRGSSLIGRSALDSPPSVRDEKQGDGSNNNSGSNTPDKWWNHWITNEATRRAAFAAFVIDSTHATMFGHAAVMVAHEMRLPLPCNEALWSATSSAEVGRVEASLNAEGVKPTTFLEGLKKTLNGQKVRTNSFGRTVLMAGLLSVSWHMNQRDLQVSTLGVLRALGGRDKWRGSLTRAFDSWRLDYHSSVGTTSNANPNGYPPLKQLPDDNVYESRTVLHHLAHMAMHVDIVDCQIFAGAQRLLGRTIGHQDYHSATRRMKESWAPSARARDATYFALQFLSQVFITGDETAYVAREDFLLNRPWVLYFAALIVWSYGYALEGKITADQPPLDTPSQKMADLQSFLRRVGSVAAPDDLQWIKDRNRCAGLLLVLRDMFVEARWELLREAAKLLDSCVEMLTGTT